MTSDFYSIHRSCSSAVNDSPVLSNFMFLLSLIDATWGPYKEPDTPPLNAIRKTAIRNRDTQNPKENEETLSIINNWEKRILKMSNSQNNE